MANPEQMFDDKFDLVISLGESCGCAGFLNRTHLRTASYPFDWVGDVEFEDRVKLILNRFEGFLKKENLQIRSKVGDTSVDHRCDTYKDTGSGIVLPHAFPSNVPLEESYESVKAKFDRRIDRLYSKVEASNKVLFVWYGMTSKVSIPCLVWAQRSMSELFGKQVYILVLENKPMETGVLCEKPSEYALHYTFDFKIRIPGAAMGDPKIACRFFSKIRCKGKNMNIFKKAVVQIACACIPLKAWRQAVRDKLRKLIRYGQYVPR